jgi:hypothetical protein
VVVEVACEPDLMEEGSTWFDAAEIGENDRERIDLSNAAQLFNLPNNVCRQSDPKIRGDEAGKLCAPHLNG